MDIDIGRTWPASTSTFLYRLALEELPCPPQMIIVFAVQFIRDMNRLQSSSTAVPQVGVFVGFLQMIGPLAGRGNQIVSGSSLPLILLHILAWQHLIHLPS